MIRPWRYWLFLATAAGVGAAPIVFTLPRPERKVDSFWPMGAARSPERHVLTVDAQCLRFDGEAWLPVAAAFLPAHGSAPTWREALRRLRAAGVEIVLLDVGGAPGKDSPALDAPERRRVVALARELGLYVILRWRVPSAPLPPNSDGVAAAGEQSATRFREAAAEWSSALWKEGGPVIGLEFDRRDNADAKTAPGDDLRTLKQAALAAGLDVPLYLAAGWPAAALDEARGEVVAVAPGPAPRTAPTPAFTGGIGGERSRADGGGGAASDAAAVESEAVRALGRGSVYLQYALPTPTAIAPTWHALRRLHLFLRDCGSDMALMSAFEPTEQAAAPVETYVRSDGWRGFVFAHVSAGAAAEQGDRATVQFELRLADAQVLRLPREPAVIPAGSNVWWPFNLNLGHLTLVSASARPITHVVDPAGTRTLIFAATEGVPPEFVLRAGEVNRIETSGSLDRVGDTLVVGQLHPGHAPAVRVLTAHGGIVQIVLLSDAESLRVWKGRLAGRERVAITAADVVFAGDALRLTVPGGIRAALSLRPAPAEVRADGAKLVGAPDGAFGEWTLPSSRETRTCTISAEPRPEPPLPRNFRTDVAAPPPPRGF